MPYTTATLIDRIVKRGIIPANQATLEQIDICNIATDLISGQIVPFINELKQEYFVRSTYQRFVANQEAYDLPYRSVGRILRDVLAVQYVSGSPDLTTAYDLAYIEPEYAHTMQTGDKPVGFYFREDQIIPVPKPTTTDYGFILKWFLAPSELCLISSASQVSAIPGGNSLNVSSVGTGIVTGALVDFTQSKAGHRLLGMDAEISSVGGVNVVFPASTIPSDIAVGDWITPAGTSPVIMLPDDAMPLLVTLTCQRILKSLGDSEGAKDLAEDVSLEWEGLRRLLKNRVQGEPQKLVNRDGLLRRRISSRAFLLRQP